MADAAAAASTGPPSPYGLPPLPQLPCPEFRGPTPWSNWVIKGRLLAGAYPASLDDSETDRILSILLELGVNTFVCLQAEFSLHTPESAWHTGQGLRPYIKDAQKILIRARETQSQHIKQDKLDFLHLPIIDGNVTSDTAMSRLADDCCMRILRGERMYIHCWGGHGRTGTLVAVMLGRLYSITCSAALRFTQAFHDSRKFPQGVRSPQTHPQVAQVKRLLPDPPSCRGVAYTRDPSVVLDDIILRPRSAPSSPTVRQLPLAVAEEAAVEMEIDGSQQLPSVPLNQQRKEAIRAKHVGGASTGSGSSGLAEHLRAAAGALGSSAGITAAMQAGSLQPTASSSAPAAATVPEGIAAGPLTAGEKKSAQDWLQHLFAKDRSSAAGSIGPASGQQQQKQPAESLPASIPAKQVSGKGITGGGVIHLNATSGSTHLQPASFPGSQKALGSEAAGMPDAVAATGPERSASSMSRLMNLLLPAAK